MTGMADRVMLKVPVRWTPITACQSLSVSFQTTRSQRMPALLTTTSSRPVSTTSCWIACSTSVGFDTSTANGSTSCSCPTSAASLVDVDHGDGCSGVGEESHEGATDAASAAVMSTVRPEKSNSTLMLARESERALGPVDLHQVSGPDRRRCADGTDDGGDSEVPRNDHRVAQLASHLGDDGHRADEEVHPAGVGDRSDEHLAGFGRFVVVHVADDPSPSGHPSWAACGAGDLLHDVGRGGLALLQRPLGDRNCLAGDDEQRFLATLELCLSGAAIVDQLARDQAGLDGQGEIIERHEVHVLRCAEHAIGDEATADP